MRLILSIIMPIYSMFLVSSGFPRISESGLYFSALHTSSLDKLAKSRQSGPASRAGLPASGWDKERNCDTVSFAGMTIVGLSMRP